MTNDSDESPERRRYRRWSKDEPPVRQRQNTPPTPPSSDEGDRLDLDALRNARAAEGLDAPLARDDYAVEYGYEYEPEPEGGLRNPYILAGLAIGAAVVLAVMVVVLFGGSGDATPGGDGNNNDPNLIVDALTPQPGANTSGRGIVAKTIAASTVREGPGTDFAQIAPLPTGQEVEVAGRNGDNSWFQIFYPQGSQLRGWVPGTALRLSTENIASLAVVSNTPVPRITVVRPTEQPSAPPVTPSITPTPLPTGTPTPQGGGVDVAVAFQNPTCIPGSSLSVIIRNSGTVALQRTAQVVVSSAAGVVSTQSFAVDLPAGSAMTLLTGVAAQPPRMTAQITLLPGANLPPDGNPANNTAECATGAAPPVTTPVVPVATPRPLPTLTSPTVRLPN